VLAAVDLERDARVAIKTLRALGADEIARIKSEFRAVRDLRHPNLVRLGELIEETGRWYFTMELIDGVDLLTYVRGQALLTTSTSWPARSVTRLERGSFSEPHGARRASAATDLPNGEREPATFDEARLRRSLEQLASALGHLHQAGTVHRDLKPSNVIVDATGRTVLIDFGVASERGAAADSQFVGTVPYIAPEQILGEDVGPAADWYAFGVILFEALTGRLPFEGSARDVMEHKCMLEPPRSSDLVRDVPPELEMLCFRLLARTPEDRATGADVARALGIAGPSAVNRQAPFVGRRRELTELARAYEDVARGDAVSVVLEGESGVGKSALARQFVGDLRAAGSSTPVLVLSGRCHEHEVVPYNAFDAVIDALARHLRARRATTRAEILPPNMDRVRTLFPTVGLIEGKAASETPRALDARAVRDEAFAALRELFRRVSERWPLVLLLEDVQWADADSLALLEALTEPPGAPCILVVATARKLDQGSACAAVGALRGDVRRVAIDGLGAEEGLVLIERLLARSDARASVDARAIFESTRGHPMFMDELVRYLSRPGEKSGAVALDDALRARVAELGEDARAVLAVVAAAGAPTEQNVIAAAARVPFATYSDAAVILHEAKLVRMRGTRADESIEPFHDRVREAVYANLDEAQRTAIHASLAAALETRGAVAELLFHHFAAADNRPRAFHYAEIAADAAGRALAFDRAVELQRSAIAIAPKDPAQLRRLLTTLGERLIDAGRSKEAAQCFLDASITGNPERAEHLDLVRRAAERFLMSGHIEEGLEATRVVLEASGLTYPTTRLGSIAKLGWYHFRLSRNDLHWTSTRPEDVTPSAAMRIDLCWSVSAGLGLVDSIRSVLFTARGALESLEHGDDARIARALAMAAIGEAGLLRPEGAARLGAACRRAADADGSERSRFYASLVAMAEPFFLTNDWPTCIARAREAQALWTTTGRTEGWEVDIVDQFTCWALDNSGRFVELGERVPAKIRAAQRAGNRFVEVNFRTEFVNLRLLLDRPEEARIEVEQAIAAWPRTGADFGNQDYLALRGLTSVALYERNEQAAAALLPQWRRYFASLMGRVLFLRMDALWNVGAIALVRAQAARRRGEESEVNARLREARRAHEAVGKIDLPYARANAAQLRIGIASIERDVATVTRVSREAIRDAEARGAELHAAALRTRLAAILGGDEGEIMARRATAWMETQRVRAPERLIGTVLPASDPGV
jgi:tetratricopeptide (TPR) repeat protein